MTEHEASFTWGAGPQSVSIAGGFNDWSATATPLLKQSDGSFKAVVPIPWGSKQAYKYIVDGEWMVREDEQKEYDAAGNHNNIYIAPATAPSGAGAVNVPTSGQFNTTTSNIESGVDGTHADKEGLATQHPSGGVTGTVAGALGAGAAALGLGGLVASRSNDKDDKDNKDTSTTGSTPATFGAGPGEELKRDLPGQSTSPGATTGATTGATGATTTTDPTTGDKTAAPASAGGITAGITGALGAGAAALGLSSASASSSPNEEKRQSTITSPGVYASGPPGNVGTIISGPGAGQPVGTASGTTSGDTATKAAPEQGGIISSVTGAVGAGAAALGFGGSDDKDKDGVKDSTVPATGTQSLAASPNTAAEDKSSSGLGIGAALGAGAAALGLGGYAATRGDDKDKDINTGAVGTADAPGTAGTTGTAGAPDATLTSTAFGVPGQPDTAPTDAARSAQPSSGLGSSPTTHTGTGVGQSFAATGPTTTTTTTTTTGTDASAADKPASGGITSGHTTAGTGAALGAAPTGAADSNITGPGAIGSGASAPGQVASDQNATSDPAHSGPGGALVGGAAALGAGALGAGAYAASRGDDKDRGLTGTGAGPNGQSLAGTGPTGSTPGAVPEAKASQLLAASAPGLVTSDSAPGSELSTDNEGSETGGRTKTDAQRARDKAKKARQKAKKRAAAAGIPYNDDDDTTDITTPSHSGYVTPDAVDENGVEATPRPGDRSASGGYAPAAAAGLGALGAGAGAAALLGRNERTDSTAATVGSDSVIAPSSASTRAIAPDTPGGGTGIPASAAPADATSFDSSVDDRGQASSTSASDIEREYKALEGQPGASSARSRELADAGLPGDTTTGRDTLSRGALGAGAAGLGAAALGAGAYAASRGDDKSAITGADVATGAPSHPGAANFAAIPGSGLGRARQGSDTTLRAVPPHGSAPGENAASSIEGVDPATGAPTHPGMDSKGASAFLDKPASVDEAGHPRTTSSTGKVLALGAGAAGALGAAAYAVTGIGGPEPISVEEAKKRGIDVDRIPSREGPTDAVHQSAPPEGAVQDLQQIVDGLKKDDHSGALGAGVAGAGLGAGAGAGLASQHGSRELAGAPGATGPSDHPLGSGAGAALERTHGAPGVGEKGVSGPTTSSFASTTPGTTGDEQRGLGTSALGAGALGAGYVASRDNRDMKDSPSITGRGEGDYRSIDRLSEADVSRSDIKHPVATQQDPLADFASGGKPDGSELKPGTEIPTTNVPPERQSGQSGSTGILKDGSRSLASDPSGRNLSSDPTAAGDYGTHPGHSGSGFPAGAAAAGAGAGALGAAALASGAADSTRPHPHGPRDSASGHARTASQEAGVAHHDNLSPSRDPTSTDPSAGLPAPGTTGSASAPGQSQSFAGDRTHGTGAGLAPTSAGFTGTGPTSDLGDATSPSSRGLDSAPGQSFASTGPTATGLSTGPAGATPGLSGGSTGLTGTGHSGATSTGFSSEKGAPHDFSSSAIPTDRSERSGLGVGSGAALGAGAAALGAGAYAATRGRGDDTDKPLTDTSDLAAATGHPSARTGTSPHLDARTTDPTRTGAGVGPGAGTRLPSDIQDTFSSSPDDSRGTGHAYGTGVGHSTTTGLPSTETAGTDAESSELRQPGRLEPHSSLAGAPSGTGDDSNRGINPTLGAGAGALGGAALSSAAGRHRGHGHDDEDVTRSGEFTSDPSSRTGLSGSHPSATGAGLTGTSPSTGTGLAGNTAGSHPGHAGTGPYSDKVESYLDSGAAPGSQGRDAASGARNYASTGADDRSSSGLSPGVLGAGAAALGAGALGAGAYAASRGDKDRDTRDLPGTGSTGTQTGVTGPFSDKVESYLAGAPGTQQHKAVEQSGQYSDNVQSYLAGAPGTQQYKAVEQSGQYSDNVQSYVSGAPGSTTAGRDAKDILSGTRDFASTGADDRSGHGPGALGAGAAALGAGALGTGAYAASRRDDKGITAPGGEYGRTDTGLAGSDPTSGLGQGQRTAHVGDQSNIPGSQGYDASRAPGSQGYDASCGPGDARDSVSGSREFATSGSGHPDERSGLGAGALGAAAGLGAGALGAGAYAASRRDDRDVSAPGGDFATTGPAGTGLTGDRHASGLTGDHHRTGGLTGDHAHHHTGTGLTGDRRTTGSGLTGDRDRHATGDHHHGSALAPAAAGAGVGGLAAHEYSQRRGDAPGAGRTGLSGSDPTGTSLTGSAPTGSGATGPYSEKVEQYLEGAPGTQQHKAVEQSGQYSDNVQSYLSGGAPGKSKTTSGGREFASTDDGRTGSGLGAGALGAAAGLGAGALGAGAYAASRGNQGADPAARHAAGAGTGPYSDKVDQYLEGAPGTQQHKAVEQSGQYSDNVQSYLSGGAPGTTGASQGGVGSGATRDAKDAFSGTQGFAATGPTDTGRTGTGADSRSGLSPGAVGAGAVGLGAAALGTGAYAASRRDDRDPSAPGVGTGGALGDASRDAKHAISAPGPAAGTAPGVGALGSAGPHAPGVGVPTQSTNFAHVASPGSSTTPSYPVDKSAERATDAGSGYAPQSDSPGYLKPALAAAAGAGALGGGALIGRELSDRNRDQGRDVTEFRETDARGQPIYGAIAKETGSTAAGDVTAIAGTARGRDYEEHMALESVQTRDQTQTFMADEVRTPAGTTTTAVEQVETPQRVQALIAQQDPRGNVRTALAETGPDGTTFRSTEQPHFTPSSGPEYISGPNAATPTNRSHGGSVDSYDTAISGDYDDKVPGQHGSGVSPALLAGAGAGLAAAGAGAAYAARPKHDQAQVPGQQQFMQPGQSQLPGQQQFMQPGQTGQFQQQSQYAQPGQDPTSLQAGHVPGTGDRTPRAPGDYESAVGAGTRGSAFIEPATAGGRGPAGATTGTGHTGPGVAGIATGAGLGAATGAAIGSATGHRDDGVPSQPSTTSYADNRRSDIPGQSYAVGASNQSVPGQRTTSVGQSERDTAVRPATGALATGALATNPRGPLSTAEAREGVQLGPSDDTTSPPGRNARDSAQTFGHPSADDQSSHTGRNAGYAAAGAAAAGAAAAGLYGASRGSDNNLPSTVDTDKTNRRASNREAFISGVPSNAKSSGYLAKTPDAPQVNVPGHNQPSKLGQQLQSHATQAGHRGQAYSEKVQEYVSTHPVPARGTGAAPATPPRDGHSGAGLGGLAAGVGATAAGLGAAGAAHGTGAGDSALTKIEGAGPGTGAPAPSGTGIPEPKTPTKERRRSSLFGSMFKKKDRERLQSTDAETMPIDAASAQAAARAKLDSAGAQSGVPSGAPATTASRTDAPNTSQGISGLPGSIGKAGTGALAAGAGVATGALAAGHKTGTDALDSGRTAGTAALDSSHTGLTGAFDDRKNATSGLASTLTTGATNVPGHASSGISAAGQRVSSLNPSSTGAQRPSTPTGGSRLSAPPGVGVGGGASAPSTPVKAKHVTQPSTPAAHSTHTAYTTESRRKRGFFAKLKAALTGKKLDDQ